MFLRFDDTETYKIDDVLAQAQSLTPYIRSITKVALSGNYDAPEASINLAFDEDLRIRVKEVVAQKVTSALKYIFVVGIGGSNLGTKAIYDALYGYRDILPENRPRLIFVDTTNDATLRFYSETVLASVAKADELLIISISKSGGTTETIANSEILITVANAKLGNVSDRVVVITDEGSAFETAASEKDITYLSIPKQVGGRYSVLSAVGLLPLWALGLDIDALHTGARDIRSYCLNEDLMHNPAAQSAAVMAYQYKNGKTINDTFVFNNELESLGKWYRQLLGESIGKEHNKDGEQVFTGITPSVSVGSTDLHSVGQLYLGGPKDKLTTFVYSMTKTESLQVPPERTFPSVVTMINGKSTKDIMGAILEGVKIAYTKQQLPFMSVELAGITPYELGAFMQFKMLEMMYLGHLLNVNPFDQPNVESYKIETKRLLEAK